MPTLRVQHLAGSVGDSSTLQHEFNIEDTRSTGGGVEDDQTSANEDQSLSYDDMHYEDNFYDDIIGGESEQQNQLSVPEESVLRVKEETLITNSSPPEQGIQEYDQEIEADRHLVVAPLSVYSYDDDFYNDIIRDSEERQPSVKEEFVRVKQEEILEPHTAQALQEYDNAIPAVANQHLPGIVTSDVSDERRNTNQCVKIGTRNDPHSEISVAAAAAQQSESESQEEGRTIQRHEHIGRVQADDDSSNFGAQIINGPHNNCQREDLTTASLHHSNTSTNTIEASPRHEEYKGGPLYKHSVGGRSSYCNEDRSKNGCTVPFQGFMPPFVSHLPTPFFPSNISPYQHASSGPFTSTTTSNQQTMQGAPLMSFPDSNQGLVLYGGAFVNFAPQHQHQSVDFKNKSVSANQTNPFYNQSFQMNCPSNYAHHVPTAGQKKTITTANNMIQNVAQSNAASSLAWKQPYVYTQQSLGDFDDMHERSFKIFYSQLVKYKNSHGHCEPPKIGTSTYATLGIWCSHVRHLRRKDLKRKGTERLLLKDAEVQKLDDLGFRWNIKPTFEDRFVELMSFKAKFGHCDAPKTKSSEYYSLGRWCSDLRQTLKKRNENQKRLKHKLTDDHVKRLSDEGFNWSFLSDATKK